MDPYGEVAAQYADFALHAEADSPCLAEWARSVAGDPEVLTWVGSLPGIKTQPNLVFAVARWHGVPAPGPYAAFREAVLGDDGTLRATVLSRSTQTNEVGRLATLLPAFWSLAGERPLALLEVGASAGLNLLPDRWGYDWRTASGPVRLGPEPRLPCEVRGAPPLPERLPRVSWRGGIDLHPLSVLDDDAMAWLEILVWPEQEDRRERLRHAVRLARRDPPRIVAGDLLEELPSLVAEASGHGTVVVFHSAVAAYLTEEDRRRMRRLLLGLVGEGACHWVSNEALGVFPEISATVPGDHRGHFVLGVDGRMVARTHGHGRYLHWLG